MTVIDDTAGGGARRRLMTAVPDEPERPLVTRAEQPGSALVSEIVRMLHRRGAWCLAVNVEPRQRRGVPRILACHSGRFLAIEVKAPRGPGPTRPQRLGLEALDRSGAITLVARSVDEVEAVLDDLRHNPPEILALERMIG